MEGNEQDTVTAIEIGKSLSDSHNPERIDDIQNPPTAQSTQATGKKRHRKRNKQKAVAPSNSTDSYAKERKPVSEKNGESKKDEEAHFGSVQEPAVKTKAVVTNQGTIENNAADASFSPPPRCEFSKSLRTSKTPMMPFPPRDSYHQKLLDEVLGPISTTDPALSLSNLLAPKTDNGNEGNSATHQKQSIKPQKLTPTISHPSASSKSKKIPGSIHSKAKESKDEPPIEEILAQITLEERHKKKKKHNQTPTSATRVTSSLPGSKVYSTIELNFLAVSRKLLQQGNLEALLALYNNTIDFLLRRNDEVDIVLVVLGLQSILADIWIDLRELSEAARLMEFILRKENQRYGPFHMETVTSQLCLASIYVKLEKWTEAAQLYSEIREIFEMTFGPDAEPTIETEHNYTKMLHKQGETSNAIPLYRKVIEKTKLVFGSFNEKTLEAQYNLACALHAEEMLNEAFDLFHNVYEKREKMLGPGHILTVHCQSRKAHVLSDKRKYAKSIELYQWVVRQCGKIMGDTHPNTLWEQNKLASVYTLSGRLAEACALISKIEAAGIEASGDFRGRCSEGTFVMNESFIESIDVSDMPIFKKVSVPR